MPEERSGAVTMRGNPVTLVGPEIKAGDVAPDFTAVDNDLGAVDLSDSAGKVRVLNVIVSVDTPVCDAQTRRFNEEAAGLGSGVEILTLSMDLPFAQKRWCGDAGVDRVKTLSDYQTASFGEAYGVLIQGLRLHAPAIFVVDGQGAVRYVEYVPEITDHPDYDAVIAAVKQLQG
jgi:thiol peroxidase